MSQTNSFLQPFHKPKQLNVNLLLSSFVFFRFAIAIIPTYEDPSDASTSSQLNFRRDWRWLNTINRVNSGVKKTVILTYVTIPRFCDLKFDKNNGDLLEWKNPGCLKYYNIKEVSIRRFIPTRMRD